MKFLMQAARYNITRIFSYVRAGLALSTPPSGITSQLYARAHSFLVRAVLRDLDALVRFGPLPKLRSQREATPRAHTLTPPRDTIRRRAVHQINPICTLAGGGSFAEWMREKWKPQESEMLRMRL
jgi:hypothetical protein